MIKHIASFETMNTHKNMFSAFKHLMLVKLISEIHQSFKSSLSLHFAET